MISSDVEWLPGQNLCVNHPHNFYTTFCRNWHNWPLNGFTYIISIIKSTYNSRNQNKKLSATRYCIYHSINIIFPIQQTGNFFGQWKSIHLVFCRLRNEQQSRFGLKIKSVKFLYILFLLQLILILYILFILLDLYTK